MNNFKVISDLLPFPSYSVIILCFFFPFFLIKCGDTTLMAVDGKDLITGVSEEQLTKKMGKSFGEDSMLGSMMGEKDELSSPGNDSDGLESDKDLKKGKEKKGIPASPYIIVALLAAIIGLVVPFIKSIKKKYVFHITLSAIGFLSLLIFYLGFQSQLDGLGNNSMGFGGSEISISYGFGTAFYVCILTFVIILAFFSLYAYFIKNTPNGAQQNKSIPSSEST